MLRAALSNHAPILRSSAARPSMTTINSSNGGKAKTTPKQAEIVTTGKIVTLQTGLNAGGTSGIAIDNLAAVADYSTPQYAARPAFQRDQKRRRVRLACDHLRRFCVRRVRPPEHLSAERISSPRCRREKVTSGLRRMPVAEDGSAPSSASTMSSTYETATGQPTR